MSKQIGLLDRLEDFINDYLPNVKGLSANTVKSYKDTFRLMIIYFEDKKSIPCKKLAFIDLNVENIKEFLKWLEEDRSCSSSTRNQRLAALSSFSVYAQNMDFDAASVYRSAVIKIPKKKSINKKKSYFTVEEVRILLALPDDNYETGLRNKVLLSLMYATGARAQEICDLKVKDFNFNVKPVTVSILGKGCKRRQISIPDKAGIIIYKYIRHRKIDDKPDSFIFSSQTHEKMSVSCIEEIFKKYIKEAKELHPDLFKMESYSPHSMRHTTATHMVEMGIPLVVIKNFLGHSSITTTEVYIEIAQNTIDKNVREWNKKWFGPSVKADKKNDKNDIPSFLK